MAHGRMTLDLVVPDSSGMVLRSHAGASLQDGVLVLAASSWADTGTGATAELDGGVILLVPAIDDAPARVVQLTNLVALVDAASMELRADISTRIGSGSDTGTENSDLLEAEVVVAVGNVDASSSTTTEPSWKGVLRLSDAGASAIGAPFEPGEPFASVTLVAPVGETAPEGPIDPPGEQPAPSELSQGAAGEDAGTDPEVSDGSGSPEEQADPTAGAEPAAAVDLMAPVATPEPGSAAALAATPVVGGYLDWGIKETFRNYIVGPIARGSVSTSGGATVLSDATHRFPAVGSGSYDAATGATSAQFAGSVSFRGHGYHNPEAGDLLQMTVSNIRIQASGSTGTLFADVVTLPLEGDITDPGPPGEAVTYSGVALASLTLAGTGPQAVGDDGVAWIDAPATLTEEGAPAFADFYAAGTPLDPVSYTLAVEEVPTGLPEAPAGTTPPPAASGPTGGTSGSTGSTAGGSSSTGGSSSLPTTGAGELSGRLAVVGGLALMVGALLALGSRRRSSAAAVSAGRARGV